MIRVTISRRMEMTGHVACIGEKRHALKIWVGISERKRQVGR